MGFYKKQKKSTTQTDKRIKNGFEYLQAIKNLIISNNNSQQQSQ